MAKKIKPHPSVQLPKNALSRISLGQSFAEYDPLIKKKDVFVTTPAYQAAATPEFQKCFFIGRRGTGKTAINLSVCDQSKSAVQIHPQVLAPLAFDFDLDEFRESHQKAFKSLTSGFALALLLEFAMQANARGKIDVGNLPLFAQKEIKISDNADFDLRVIRLIDAIIKALKSKKDAAWLKENKKWKELGKVLNKENIGRRGEITILIDRIDDSWDGSDQNVIFLAAFMHACVEVMNLVEWGRVLLFLRENVFERVRAIDTEFARLETSVVGLEWTREKLLELVERRLMVPFNTKLPLGGAVWAAFFEDPDKTQDVVFDYCQNRPRDLITYCGLAVDNALSRNHQKIQIDDLLDARKRFSDSRLKDLCDEYDENYPQLQLVISRFYGLGWRYTVRGVDSFIKKLILDKEVKVLCARWLFNYTVPQLFARLLYDIGFFGIRNSNGEILYRSMGPQSTAAPGVGDNTDFEVHPSYRASLDLQDLVVGSSDEDLKFSGHGIISELPGSISPLEYGDRLNELEMSLKTMSKGIKTSRDFEDVVGDVLRLCFYRSLTNVEPRERDIGGCVVRDWIASNCGSGGFWEMVRIKYGAVQIVWECKNYDRLKADDFHQAAYYMNDQIGRFCIVVFRGEIQPHDWDHLNRICRDNKGLVLLLTEKDLLVFIRQSRSGKVKDAHIQDRFDKTIRKLS